MISDLTTTFHRVHVGEIGSVLWSRPRENNTTTVHLRCKLLCRRKRFCCWQFSNFYFLPSLSPHLSRSFYYSRFPCIFISYLSPSLPSWMLLSFIPLHFHPVSFTDPLFSCHSVHPFLSRPPEPSLRFHLPFLRHQIVLSLPPCNWSSRAWEFPYLWTLTHYVAFLSSSRQIQ